MDFHERPDVEVVIFAQVQLVSNALIIRCIELRKEGRAVEEVIGSSSAESEASKQDFKVGGGG